MKHEPYILTRRRDAAGACSCGWHGPWLKPKWDYSAAPWASADAARHAAEAEKVQKDGQEG